MPKKSISLEERFWSKVKMRGGNECWDWQAGINSTGRGIFWINGASIHAHRMAMILITGVDIPKGKWVLHTCDNGKCCNPNHLYIGTAQDNVNDMIARGRKRTLRGDDDPKSKLTELQVREIKRLYVPRKFSQFKLADIFGVSRSTIQGILERRIWKHVI